MATEWLDPENHPSRVDLATEALAEAATKQHQQ